jgi:hypothetical protein
MIVPKLGKIGVLARALYAFNISEYHDYICNMFRSELFAGIVCRTLSLRTDLLPLHFPEIESLP